MSRKLVYTKIPRFDGGGATTSSTTSATTTVAASGANDINLSDNLKISTEMPLTSSNAAGSTGNITSRIKMCKPSKLKIQNTTTLINKQQQQQQQSTKLIENNTGGSMLRKKIIKRFASGKSNVCTNSTAITNTTTTLESKKQLNQEQQSIKTIPSAQQQNVTIENYENEYKNNRNDVDLNNLTSSPLHNRTITTTETPTTNEKRISSNYFKNNVQINDKKTSTPTEQKKSSINVTFSALDTSQCGNDCRGGCGSGGGGGGGVGYVAGGDGGYVAAGGDGGDGGAACSTQVEGDTTMIMASSDSYCFGETFDNYSPVGNISGLSDLTLVNADGNSTFINQDNSTIQSELTFTNKQQQQQQQQLFPFMPDLTDCTLDCSIELYDSIASNEISSSHGSPRLKQQQQQQQSNSTQSNHQLLCSQNSFEIDDSFGILTPEQMGEFPDVSVTPRMELFLKFRENPLDTTIPPAKLNQENTKNHLYYLNQPNLYAQQQQQQQQHQQQQHSNYHQNYQHLHHHHHDHNHLCQIDQTPSPEELPLDPISVTTTTATTTTDLLMGNYGIMTSSTDTQNSQNSLRGNSSGSASVIGQILSADPLIIGNSIVVDEEQQEHQEEFHNHHHHHHHEQDHHHHQQQIEPTESSYSIKTITDPSSSSGANHGKPLNSFITSITSITSLDTGYQGDGELSRPGSRTAAVTTTVSSITSNGNGGGGVGFDRISPSIIVRSEEPASNLPSEIDSEFYDLEKFDRKHDKQQLLQSHYLYNNQQHHTDTMTDSDFYTESEADDGGHHNHNHHNHHPRAGKRVKKDTSCLESSGIFTDNDNRADDELQLIEQSTKNNYNNENIHMLTENSTSYNNNNNNNNNSNTTTAATTANENRLINDDKKSSNNMMTSTTTKISSPQVTQAHFSTTNSLSQYSITSQQNNINDICMSVIAKTKTSSSSSSLSSSSVVVVSSSTPSSSSSSPSPLSLIKNINNKLEISTKQLLLNSGENNNEIYVGRHQNNYIVTSATAAATSVTSAPHPPITTTTTTTKSLSSLECFSDISSSNSNDVNNINIGNRGNGFGGNSANNDGGIVNLGATPTTTSKTNLTNTNNKNCYKKSNNNNKNLSAVKNLNQTLSECDNIITAVTTAGNSNDNNSTNHMENKKNINNSGDVSMSSSLTSTTNCIQLNFDEIDLCNRSGQQQLSPTTSICSSAAGVGGGGGGCSGSGRSSNVTIRKMPPNKWDAVMNKIATNKIKLHKTKKDYNEVKPKVTSGLTKRLLTPSNGISNTPLLLSPHRSPSTAKRELILSSSKRGRTKSNTPSPHNHSRSPQNERLKLGEKRFGSTIISPAAAQVNTFEKVKQVTAATAATTSPPPPSTIRKINKTINIKRTPLKDHNELVLEQLQISPKAQKISPKLSSKSAQTAGTNNNTNNNNNNNINNNNSSNNNNINSNNHYAVSSTHQKQQLHSQPPPPLPAATALLVVEQNLNKNKKSKELQIIKNANANCVAYATKSTTTEDLKLMRDDAQENKSNNDIAALGVVIQYLAFHLDAFNNSNLKESHERAKNALDNTKIQLDVAIANNKYLENKLLQKDSTYLDREKDIQKQYEFELEKVKKLRNDFEESVTGRITSLEQEIHDKDLATEQELQSHINAFNIKLAEQEQYITSAKNKESELLKRINVLSSTENELREKVHMSENEFGERLRDSSVRERDLTEKIQLLNGKIQQMEIDHQKLITDTETIVLNNSNSNNSPSKNEHKKIRRKSNNNSHDFITTTDDNNLSMEKDKMLRPEMLEEEVKSLRSVLDLKQREISELRKQNQLLDKDSHSLPNALVKISSLESRLEDLQIQLKTKTDDEQECFQKIKHLEQSLQHEASSRKSLALRNEQLQWKLKQNSEKMKMAIAELSRRYQDHSDFLMETQESLYGVFDNSSTSMETSSSNISNFGDNSIRPQHPTSICDLSTASTSSTTVDTNESLVKGVVEKNESVSWILEIKDEESAEALASRIVRRAGSFRSSLNERINNGNQYINNSNKKTSHQQQQLLSLSNPISQSASATSILRQYSLDTSPTFQKHSTSINCGGGGGGGGGGGASSNNIRDTSRLRSKSLSTSVTNNTSGKKSLGNSPKIEQQKINSNIEWPNDCRSRISSSSPNMHKNRNHTIDNDDEDDEYDDNLELSGIFIDQQHQQTLNSNSNLKMIIDEENDDYSDLYNKSFRRHNSMKKINGSNGGNNGLTSGGGGGGGGCGASSSGNGGNNTSSGSRKQLITCSAAGLSSGIHETNNKKYHLIKESAGEAMVSGTTSDDEEEDASTTSSDDSISIGSTQTNSSGEHSTNQNDEDLLYELVDDNNLQCSGKNFTIIKKESDTFNNHTENITNTDLNCIS